VFRRVLFGSDESFVHLTDFVSLADGADWTVALRAAIDYVTKTGGAAGTVILPDFGIKLCDTITVNQRRGLVIAGQGWIASDIEWSGDRERPMFTINRSQCCYLEKFSITAR